MEEKETIVIDIQLDENGVANQLAQVNEQIAAVKSQNAKLRKEVKDGNKTWQEVSGQLAVNEQRLKTLTTTQKVLTNQFNAQVGTNKRLGDSLKEMGSELTALKNEYRSLSKEERESAKGQELLKHIQDLDAKMKEADGTMGDFQRNVGNYPDAVKPVTAQLKEMTQALIQMRMEGKANTQEYQDLLQVVGKLKDSMADAQREVKQMASDTGALNSVLDAGKLAAGAFSAALGVMNLVGDKDSETAKAMADAQRKLQAAIAVTTGLQAVQNALQKESALMMGVHKIQVLAAAKAQDAYTAATGRATVAQRLFNTVAKANPYVLLSGLILTVVGAVFAFTRGSKEQEEQVEETNKELKTQISLLKELNEQYHGLRDAAIEERDYQIEMAELTGASAKTIKELKKARLDYMQQALDADNREAESLRLTLSAVTAAYHDNVAEMKTLLAKRNQMLAEGNKEAAEWIQNDMDNLQKLINKQKEQIDYVASLDARQRAINLERQRLSNTTTKTVVNNIAKVKRELVSLVEVLTLEQIAEKNQRIADSIQKVIDKVGLLKTSVEQLPEIDLSKYMDVDLDNSLDRFEPSALEKFSAAYENYAQQIQETSSAVESSFSSVASMYKTMANDETKSEEERAAAAKKAKTWSKMQIAANAGTAVAKGVASAVDVGFPAAIPAIATMLAAILSAIAQAKSLAQEGYEHGGPIGGFHGASMGPDDTLINARHGEIVFNAEQQKRLFDIANGTATSSLTASLVTALSALPAPVVDYQEFTRFQTRVASFNENSRLR